MELQRIALRAFNTPLLMHPGRARTVLDSLARRMSREPMRMMEDDDREPSREEQIGAILSTGPRGERKVYHLIDGVAVIPVEGILAHRFGYLDPACGMTGYDGLAVKLRLAMQDDDVRAVFFDIDSPGGEVAGCFAFCDEIDSYRGQKPIWATANEMAASAAYAIASQCDRIVMPEAAWAGSVGVIWAHWDYSKLLETAGVKVTIIAAGAHKADGNEFEAMPPEVRADFQRQINQLYSMFTARVARGRRMDEAAVKATEAQTYLGRDAVATKFADAIMDPSAALSELVEQVRK